MANVATLPSARESITGVPRLKDEIPPEEYVEEEGFDGGEEESVDDGDEEYDEFDVESEAEGDIEDDITTDLGEDL